MDQTDRRSAHRRVGAATIAAFLVLLLLGATRGPAQADTTVPAAAPRRPRRRSSRPRRCRPTPIPIPTPIPASAATATDHDGPGFGGGAADGGGGGGFGGGAPDSGGEAPAAAAPPPRRRARRREPDMSAFMHDVARASLPVAIALLAFTAVARAALWASTTRPSCASAGSTSSR